MNRKKIGLALSGGGAAGLAHVGVLKVLEENNIPIDLISGTSMGAIIGALYSAQPNAKAIEKEAIETDWKGIFDYTISRYGLIRGRKIEQLLTRLIGNLKFSELKIPLFVTAFDIEKRQEIIFSKGEVVKAVRASISIPGIFVPVENNGRILVDGAVTDLVPIDVLRRAGADVIIAVNVDFVKEGKVLYGQEATTKTSGKKLPNMLTAITRAFQVVESEESRSELEREKADWVISPKVKMRGELDYSLKNVKSAIKIGEKEAKKSIEDLKIITESNALKSFLKDVNVNLGVKELIEGVKKDINKARRK